MASLFLLVLYLICILRPFWIHRCFVKNDFDVFLCGYTFQPCFSSYKFQRSLILLIMIVYEVQFSSVVLQFIYGMRKVPYMPFLTNIPLFSFQDTNLMVWEITLTNWYLHCNMNQWDRKVLEQSFLFGCTAGWYQAPIQFVMVSVNLYLCERKHDLFWLTKHFCHIF